MDRILLKEKLKTVGRSKTSGNEPFEFVWRPDLRKLPQSVVEFEVNLHGGFATDNRPGFGHKYYGMPGAGIMRIDPDLQHQELIKLPRNLTDVNFHGTELGEIDGNLRLILPANADEMVAIITLEGEVDFILSRPEFEQYQNKETEFNPTSVALVDDQIFVADGYGSNYISVADGKHGKWVDIFGGKTSDRYAAGLYGTAHGIANHPHHNHLVIADRPHSRVQTHHHHGGHIHSHQLPDGSFPCGIDFIEYGGRLLAVVGSLIDPVEEEPAPIYILDGMTYEVLSTIRPKIDLGIEDAQHIHDATFHIHNGQLYIVVQAWNPGFYFVLEKAE